MSEQEKRLLEKYDPQVLAYMSTPAEPTVPTPGFQVLLDKVSASLPKEWDISEVTTATIPLPAKLIVGLLVLAIVVVGLVIFASLASL